MSTNAFVQRCLKSPHFKFGLPFISLLLGASFVLRDINTTRYEYRKQKTLKDQLDSGVKKAGIQKKEANPDQVYEKYMKNEYQEDYEMIRGPRPWEDKGSFQNQDNKKIPAFKRSPKSFTDNNL